MDFGVPKEVRPLEKRVGLTPAGAAALTQAGHTVYIEHNAGEEAGFSDEIYEQAGAHIVYSADEAYGRADIVVKVTRPAAEEHKRFRTGQTIFSFLHLAASSPDLFSALAKSEITAIAYEMIQEADGALPVLLPLSEVAGRLTPILAGQLLTNRGGGRGILLGGIPGIPPAVVVILGGGVLGTEAVRAFLGLGAQVIVLDQNMKKLQALDSLFPGRITTMLSNDYNVGRAVAFADVVVGCIHLPGRRTPMIVSREMVYRMSPGSVIIDLSIDDGGCVETSRPTTLNDPTFTEAGVIHFAVPNITATVARTASYALTNAALPYLLVTGALGLPQALEQLPALAHGVNLYQGKLAQIGLANSLGRTADFDIFSGVPA